MTPKTKKDYSSYFIESLKAVRMRTLPTLDLDQNPPVCYEGMSWAKSIYYLFYWWVKKLKRRLKLK